MNKDKYEKLVSQYLSEFEIKDTLIAEGLVKVDIVPRKEGWGICTFVFAGHHIVCFGDVESYAWDCSWDTPAQIQRGSCNASNFSYLSSKLEHRHDLMLFNFNSKTMGEIKEEIIEANDFDGEELEEFNEKWEDNSYLLGSVEKNRLGGLDEFFSEMGIDDAYEYYYRFEEYPDHYYCAMAMLRCIEEHFSKMRSQEVTK